MDPKSADPSSAGAGGDAEEITLAQKRFRRVSFAETTAVHVFDRDEDFETPPDSKPDQCKEPSSSSLKLNSGSEEEEEEEVGFQSGHSDSEEDDDDVQEKFIRDMDSSAPGSAAGSVTSNDDDNFFGPVSTNFMKSDLLSEAGMSDDNHDITLDSTAFSLHFQSVAPHEDRSANSAGSFMTPTGYSVSSDSHKFAISHGSKNHDIQKTGNALDDSKNMSFIRERQDSYGRYGKLSPTLDALVTEVNGSLESKSPDGGSGMNKSPHSSLEASDRVANLPLDAAIDEKIQLAEKAVQNFSTGSYSGNIIEHSPSKLIENITTNKRPNNQAAPPVQKSSGKKRRIDQMLLTVKENRIEESRIQKIPQIFPDAVTTNSNSITAYDVEHSNKSTTMGGQTPQKHWKDIFSSVSRSTKQPFSPSISKLNSKELDSLEDILDEFQTARKYKRLYTSLTNQRVAGVHQQKRLAEARALVDKLVYEKAKLQLKQIKLDRLSNNVHICKAEVQECVKLRLMYSQLCIHDVKNTQNIESHFHHDSNNLKSSHETGYQRVTSMRQELEKLDQNVKNLMKTFESSYKIKVTGSCSEFINVVSNHIEVKEYCRLIQQKLQLWKLSDVVKTTDQCEIVLNYCDLLYQRFTIDCRSATSIVATVLKKDCIIENNFPKMNACVAFEFLFKFNEDHRLACSDQLSQETLVNIKSLFFQNKYELKTTMVSLLKLGIVSHHMLFQPVPGNSVGIVNIS